MELLGWCKSNCSFALLNFAACYWNIFLNKCGYVIHHFNVHFLLYFFANDLLLDVYIYFRLGIWCYTKSNFKQYFSLELKMGHKVAETIHNINYVFGPGTANEHTVQWWVKKFCKGDESLKDEECSDQPSEGNNDQLRAIIKISHLTTAWEVSNELNVKQSMVIQLLSQIGKVKKLDKWVPHELTINKKNWCSELLSSLILPNNNKQFLNWIAMCNEKQIVYDNQRWWALWLDGEEAPKYFPKPNMQQKRVMVTIWRSAAGLIHYSFLNSSETMTSEKYAQQTSETHWKLQCLQTASANRTGPSPLHENARLHIAQPTFQKLNELGYKVLPHPQYSPELLPTD